MSLFVYEMGRQYSSYLLYTAKGCIVNVSQLKEMSRIYAPLIPHIINQSSITGILLS